MKYRIHIIALADKSSIIKCGTITTVITTVIIVTTYVVNVIILITTVITITTTVIILMTKYATLPFCEVYLQSVSYYAK